MSTQDLKLDSQMIINRRYKKRNLILDSYKLIENGNYDFKFLYGL